MERRIIDLCLSLGAIENVEQMSVVKGVLTAASAILPSVQFKDREHRDTRCNLYYACIANAGSNKSRVGNLDKLILPIHNEIKKQEDALRSTIPKNETPPPRRNVLISGNITRARVIEHLCANNDVPLIVVDTEMDSIVTSMRADYGGFRAELRKAYHGEFISSSKITGDLLHEAHDPHMSILVTGTYDQCVNYLRPLGDGFASRHLFDVNLSQTVFKPYSNGSQLNPSLQLELWASHFLRMWEYFNKRDVLVTFEEGQYQILNEFAIKEEQSIHQGLDSNSKDFLYRHVLMQLKLASTLTAMEAYFNNDSSNVLRCGDDNFEFAYRIMTNSYSHAQDLYGVLPTEKEAVVALNDSARMVVNGVADVFTAKNAYDVGKSIGLAPRTVRDILSKLRTLKLIERTVSKSDYKKL